MSVKAAVAAMTLKVKIIIVSAAVVVVSGGAVLTGVILTQEDVYRVLKVFELTGEAIVTRENTGDLAAYVGMNLESGDMLTVGENSTLRISLDSDKYILLDSGTVLELVATGSPTDSRTSIDLKNGSILNEITTPLSANSSYEVATPKATMAVRGTSFMASVEKDDDGNYNITENTFQGEVEINLLDSNGDPTGNKASVPADSSAKVGEDDAGNGTFMTDPPVGDIDYNNIPPSIRDNAIRSNDDELMPLNDNVVNKLKGETEETESSATTTVSETQTEATTAETTTVTTVPETEASEETTVTAAPVTTVQTEPQTTAETTVTPGTKQTTVTTVPEETTKKTKKTTKKTTVTTTEQTTEDTTETAAATSETTEETTEETTTEETTTTSPINSVPNEIPVDYPFRDGPWNSTTAATTIEPTPEPTTTRKDEEVPASPSTIFGVVS